MSKRGENIYKRKDGRWEGRYIKCRTLHGRIQYGYVYGKSYSAVKSKLKETASMPIQTSDSRGTQPTSYSEILKMWLLSAKNHVKESTFSRYNHLVERHIQPFLAIARGLMSNPKIIMLDEPSLGLAPLIVNDIFDIIQEINREGVSVLLVEQNARKALSIADHACVLEQGRIVKQGTGSEIAADESIINAYLGAKK